MTNQQLSNFTDEQVRAKAHSIWLARQESGEPGNADTDWQEAVNALSENNSKKLGQLPLNYTYRLGIIILLSLGSIIAALLVF